MGFLLWLEVHMVAADLGVVVEFVMHIDNSNTRHPARRLGQVAVDSVVDQPRDSQDIEVGHEPEVYGAGHC